MDYKNVVWSIQTYSFAEVFRFLLYRENKKIRNGLCIMLVLYFVFALALMNYFKDIQLLFLMFNGLFINSCIACIIFFLSEIQHINTLRKRWKKYGFDTEKQLMLLKKENIIVIQDAYRSINLSNYIANGMVSFVDEKNVFIFYLKYLGIFFIIEKTDPNYEEIRYHLEHVEQNGETIYPNEYFYQEKISCLYFALPFSNKIDVTLRIKSVLFNCLLVILYFCELLFLTVMFTILTESKEYTGGNRNTILFTIIMGYILYILFLIWRLYSARRDSNDSSLFINTYQEINVFMNQNVVSMSNANYYIEIPFDKKIITKVVDSSPGHFRLYTKYGNFYINIPEQKTEKIQEMGNFFKMHINIKQEKR